MPWWSFVPVALAGALALGCSPATEVSASGVGGPDGGVVSGGDSAPAVASPPWILADDLVNARDVGGVTTSDGHRVVPGALFRGPPPRLSAAGCREFARLGVRTVIDLRVASELTAPPACVTDQANLVLAPLPVPYNVSPSDYIAILDAKASIAAAFHALASPDAYPLYAHCTWGRDRTGVLFGLILLALGVPRAAVIQEYLLSEPSVGAYPPSLEAALDEVELRGGIGPYLVSVGVLDGEVAALRERVLEPIALP